MFLDPDPSLNSVHAELTACLSYRELCFLVDPLLSWKPAL